MVLISHVEANQQQGDPRYIFMALWGSAEGDSEGIRNDFVYYSNGDPASNDTGYSISSYAETNNWISNRPIWFIWACDAHGNDNNIVTRSNHPFGSEPTTDHGDHYWDDDYNQEYDEDMVFAFSVYVTFQQPTQAMVNNYRQWEQQIMQVGNNQWGFCDNINFEWVTPYRNVPWLTGPGNTADIADQLGNMQIDGDDDDDIQMGPDHPDYNDNHVNNRIILRF